MSLSSPPSKLKAPAVDQTSDDDENSGADLDLPLDKLTLGPKKKLLVICLGGLLVDRVHIREKHKLRGQRPDIVNGNFRVFKRPFCTDFLHFCFARFDVALWSSAMDHNIGGVLSSITGGEGSKFVFVWGQNECRGSGFFCLHKRQKPLFVKDLKRIWENKKYEGKYSASNTLLIDDEPHSALLNPANTAIFPQQYKKHDLQDTFLGPNSEFRKYLNGLVDAKDVPSYVKDHPFGQTPITENHPDWSYYGNVIANFGKVDDDSSSDYDYGSD